MLQIFATGLSLLACLFASTTQAAQPKAPTEAQTMVISGDVEDRLRAELSAQRAIAAQLKDEARHCPVLEPSLLTAQTSWCDPRPLHICVHTGCALQVLSLQQQAGDEVAASETRLAALQETLAARDRAATALERELQLRPTREQACLPVLLATAQCSVTGVTRKPLPPDVRCKAGLCSVSCRNSAECVLTRPPWSGGCAVFAKSFALVS